jgi:hypothetical protein
LERHWVLRGTLDLPENGLVAFPFGSNGAGERDVLAHVQAFDLNAE